MNEWQEVNHSEFPVMVKMPLNLTADMLRAVRSNSLTRCDDKDEENKRIGWLLCAWEVLVEQQTRLGR